MKRATITTVEKRESAAREPTSLSTSNLSFILLSIQALFPGDDAFCKDCGTGFVRRGGAEAGSTYLRSEKKYEKMRSYSSSSSSPLVMVKKGATFVRIQFRVVIVRLCLTSGYFVASFIYYTPLEITQVYSLNYKLEFLVFYLPYYITNDLLYSTIYYLLVLWQCVWSITYIFS